MDVDFIAVEHRSAPKSLPILRALLLGIGDPTPRCQYVRHPFSAPYDANGLRSLRWVRLRFLSAIQRAAFRCGLFDVRVRSVHVEPGSSRAHSSQKGCLSDVHACGGRVRCADSVATMVQNISSSSQLSIMCGMVAIGALLVAGCDDKPNATPSATSPAAAEPSSTAAAGDFDKTNVDKGLLAQFNANGKARGLEATELKCNPGRTSKRRVCRGSTTRSPLSRAVVPLQLYLFEVVSPDCVRFELLDIISAKQRKAGRSLGPHYL